MLPHAGRDGGEGKPVSDASGVETLDVEESQESAVLLWKCVHEAAELLQTLAMKELLQHGRRRIDIIAAQPGKGVRFAAFSPAIVKAEIARRLENECRESVEVLHFPLLQRLEHDAHRLLNDVFALRSIRQPAKREQADAFRELFVQVDHQIVRAGTLRGHRMTAIVIPQPNR